jgi:hypothetical protein
MDSEDPKGALITLLLAGLLASPTGSPTPPASSGA